MVQTGRELLIHAVLRQRRALPEEDGV